MILTVQARIGDRVLEGRVHVNDKDVCKSVLRYEFRTIMEELMDKIMAAVDRDRRGDR